MDAEETRLVHMIGHFDHCTSEFLFATAANLENKAKAVESDKKMKPAWEFYTRQSAAYFDAAVYNDKNRGI